MTGGGTFGTRASLPNAARRRSHGAGPAWRNVAPMAYGRYQHNLVVLADGSVLAVGGSDISTTVTRQATGYSRAELWNPTTETWSTMAAMRDPRMYHSTAMLLPDGRVLAAGGGRLGSIPSFPTAESSRRRTCSAALGPRSRALRPRPHSETPSRSRHRRREHLSRRDRAARRGHAHAEHEPDVRRTAVHVGNTLQAKLPVNTNVTPPGYYLLFVLNNAECPADCSLPAARGFGLDRLHSSDGGDRQPVQRSIGGGDRDRRTRTHQTTSACRACNFSSTEEPRSRLTRQRRIRFRGIPRMALDGSHSLTAIARDVAGNVATSTSVSVTVSNSGGGGDKYLGHTAIGSVCRFGRRQLHERLAIRDAGRKRHRPIALCVRRGARERRAEQSVPGRHLRRSNGTPGALVASSASQAIVPDAWNTARSPPSAANTAYWLAYNTNGSSASTNNIRLAPGTANQMRWRSHVFGTWPATSDLRLEVRRCKHQSISPTRLGRPYRN